MAPKIIGTVRAGAPVLVTPSRIHGVLATERLVEGTVKEPAVQKLTGTVKSGKLRGVLKEPG